MKRRIKEGPNCKRILIRRRSIHKNKIPTICNFCGFKIEEPYKIFRLRAVTK